MDSQIRAEESLIQRIAALTAEVDQLKRANAEVRDTAGRYAHLIEVAGGGVCTLDPEGQIAFANRRVAEMLGYPTEEMIEQPLLTFVDEEWRAIAQAYMEECRKSGTECRLELMFRRRDGSELWAILSGVHLFDREGRYTGTLAMVTDSTERYRAEAAVRESEQRYRELIENAAYTVFQFELRPTPAFSYVGPSVFQLVGYSPEEFCANPRLCSEIVHPEDRHILDPRRTELRTARLLTIRWIHKDGHTVWTELGVTPILDDVGNLAAIDGIARDITDRKTAEEALRWEAGVNAAMADLSSALISIASVEDISSLVLDLAKNLTGSSFGYVGYIDPQTGLLVSTSMTRNVWDSCQMQSKDIVLKESSGLCGWVLSNRQSVLTNKPFDDPRSAGIPQGHVPIHRFLSVPALVGEKLIGQMALANSDRDYDGRDLELVERLAALYGLALQRKQLEEQLLRAQRLETAGRIAGQVAHDFNNLLGPMVGYPELIKMRLPQGHPAVPFCNAMVEAAEQMAEINTDMLALSRRGLLDQQPADMNQLVRQAIAVLGDAANTLAVDLDLASDLLPVNGSPAQLLRVLSNLVSNARDAMQDVGLLHLKTENVYVDRPFGRYNRVEVGEYARLSLTDTGCGIPAGVRDKIFDAFFTTKRTARRRGSGLGLSVVQAIVDDHRGYIDLETEVGRGTTFSIYLPVRREPLQQTPGEAVRGGSETILVVDDDKAQCEVLKRVLETLGYGVQAVQSGEEAVAHLEQGPADLLVLDMVMPPGIDGLETYRRVLEVRPGQRAIIVSGFAETERVREAQALGAGAYLRKPVNLEKLARAVREELDR